MSTAPNIAPTQGHRTLPQGKIEITVQVASHYRLVICSAAAGSQR